MSRSVTPFNLIKYHDELLPEYPGAQSIIRAIHAGASEMRCTIHRINARIDGGGIRL
jgi:methionyl-tRNA formyltransferase